MPERLRAAKATWPLDSLAVLEDELARVRLRVEATPGGWRAEPVAA